ncbi:MAG: DNA recombination protein RmuC [Phycisphaerae bacterium]|nr:DNA recombination protein RmuC [Phycisphaerae bacterium]
MEYFIGFAVGVIIGAALAVLIGYLRGRSAEVRMGQAFAALAGEALDANSRRLAETAAATLDTKKQLIDQTLKSITDRLTKVSEYFRQIEGDRKHDFGEIKSSITTLSATAGKLHEMLASSKRRGAWGERMAEDVLRLAGLQEGVNFTKQSSADAESGRPDFTFFLPNDLKANMDVKFPLEAYRGYLDADSDAARDEQLKALVAAVRGHIREVARRGYIDPNVPTVNYVLVLIPSEQIYSLVLEVQPDLIDEALEKKVVLCSPLTLYAMLAVIRQAAERANLMKGADEALALVAEFQKQWDLYKDSMEKMGKRIDGVKEDYDILTSRRTRTLDKLVAKIEDLRTSTELDAGDDTAGDS